MRNSGSRKVRKVNDAKNHKEYIWKWMKMKFLIRLSGRQSCYIKNMVLDY